ncbi:hypothetical protein PHYSODRAFT_334978 [Phytophthora sojae]|uniref:Uncharacterized protein n=1 Tax=Phytophthora sojae (strain P6497) TaxID=1094619 RepID=G4ZTS1_PHYSP|nr:hypothetical protein PHYSODRAFT_334978 [Phytophthora sojae]EGZ13195.1 hypothetical protein PHYSODRAFT_334978 [Phytophthora sojae]|eukprot:XP_009530624.1 hypothetical protein PHYSODRAFT_334978 [Phytophthora sojae]
MASRQGRAARRYSARLLELVFKEIMYIEGTAWVSLQATHALYSIDTVGRRMLQEILVFLDAPIDEDTPADVLCPIQHEGGALRYGEHDNTTKGLYFLQLAPLKKFTNEMGHFICGKVGMSE